MKRIRLGARDRRTIAIGAGLILAIVSLARGVPAYASWNHELRARSAEALDALARARRELALESAARDSSIARGQRMVALAPAILTGQTVNAGGAALEALVSGMAAQSGVRIGSAQVRSDTLSRGAFTRIGVHIDATGDVRGIAHLLSQLERGPTLLSVRSLAITQPDVTAGDDRAEALRIELDVQGLMLNPRRAP